MCIVIVNNTVIITFTFMEKKENSLNKNKFEWRMMNNMTKVADFFAILWYIFFVSFLRAGPNNRIILDVCTLYVPIFSCGKMCWWRTQNRWNINSDVKAKQSHRIWIIYKVLYVVRCVCVTEMLLTSVLYTTIVFFFFISKPKP